MLQQGDRVPHFEVARTDGILAAYASIWQQRNLLLVTTREDASAEVAETIAGLREHASELYALETACVVTNDDVPGVPAPGIVIADRWGEICSVADALSWMSADEVLEWLRFLQHKCPECEGEAK